jgi:exodeoxyribonuclease VII small subunit
MNPREKTTAVEKLSYEEAMGDLTAILEELEGEESDLDRLAERVKRASELVRHCREKIHRTEMEVEKVLKDLPDDPDNKAGA